MVTIIYILAVIGGICVISVLVMAIAIFSCKEENTDKHEPEITCALTGEHCIYTSERGACYGCPVAEEAEKIGNR
jgi:hypothetical protein